MPIVGPQSLQRVQLNPVKELAQGLIEVGSIRDGLHLLNESFAICSWMVSCDEMGNKGRDD